MTEESNPIHIYALVDGAQHPLPIRDALQGAPDIRNVYAGLPEEAAGNASLFLARIDNAKAQWLSTLDRLDHLAPCLTLIWSRAGIGELAVHLQSFLLADIGDGMTALVRYFDPRNLAFVLEVWGKDITEELMKPIQQWKYRGYAEDWQRIDGLLDGTQTVVDPVKIPLSQEQVDLITTHCEADQLLAALIENGDVNGDGAYLPRFEAFEARYLRAIQWGLEEPADRLLYCQYSYLYGADFDSHPDVRSAFERSTPDQSFGERLASVWPTVWESLLAKQRKKASRDPTQPAPDKPLHGT